MACDPVAEVRRQIVSLIALTSHTLPGKIEWGLLLGLIRFALLLKEAFMHCYEC